MALDPSLVLSQSDSSVPRLDHQPSHTSYSTTNPTSNNPHTDPTLLPTNSSFPLPANHSSTPLMNGPSQDDTTVQYPSISSVPTLNGTAPTDEDSSTGPALVPDVDPQILEALKSKDRIYVLKLGETFEALIMERKARVELTPSTSYQRLLVHRCSAYYKLAPESDPVTKAILVLCTADSRIPDRRICELVPAESTAQPSFKIMRRSVQDRRSKPHSHAGSVAGEDGDLSDPEPSESGSLGGRSNVTSSSTKKRMTIEEREAAYNEARSRIFMNFEEKEKNKEKDMSASSSSLSLNGSASTSAGGRSSIGDTDDVASSPATESEWSVPSGSNNSRDRKDGRRGGPPSASSNRSLRSGGSFHANGSGGSSRNSRAPSPSSFNYASLHDNAPGHIYDPSQHNLNPNVGYYPTQYYAYSPPGPGPSPPFMPPYPYYQAPYNPYQQPPPVSSHNPSDPTTPSGPEAYSPQHPMGYRPQYGWPHHPNQPALQSPPLITVPPPQAQQNPPHSLGPPQMQPPSSQYQPFVHPSHAYPYPMNAYYPQPHLPPPPPPPPGQQMPQPPPPPPHMNNAQTQQPPPPQHHQPQPSQQPGYDIPRVINGNPMGHTPPNGHYNGHNGNGPRNGLGNGVIPPNNNQNNNSNGRGNVRNGGSPSLMNNSNGVNGGKHRAQMPPAGRSAWSYGPGVGNGGYTSSLGSAGNEAVGPRFQTHRHVSGNSSSGGNSRSSNNDEVSSTSSSTTSSSSRRTYTSTTSSQHHPLPARPDWAVGLKAQPTLAAGRHHDLSLNNSRTMSPISPPRANGHNSPSVNGNTHHGGSSSQYTSPASLQATDFPPLTSNGGNSVPEKRTPVVSGAWGQSRPILSSPATNGANSPSVASSAQQSPVIKHEDGPKTGEIVNGKAVRRPAVMNGQVHHRSQSASKDTTATAKGDSVAGAAAALAGQVSSMSLGGEDNTIEPSTPGTNDAASATRPAIVAPAPSV